MLPTEESWGKYRDWPPNVNDEQSHLGRYKDADSRLNLRPSQSTVSQRD